MNDTLLPIYVLSQLRSKAEETAIETKISPSSLMEARWKTYRKPKWAYHLLPFSIMLWKSPHKRKFEFTL